MDESPAPRSRAKRFFTRRRVATFLYVYAGIINPVICFACAAPTGSWMEQQAWQARESWVYATLMLKWPAVLPFYPLLLFSMTCLGLFLWDFTRFARHFAVRIGVYGGIVLSILFGGLLFGTAPQSDQAVFNTILSFLLISAATMVGLIILAAAPIIGHALGSPLVRMLGGSSRIAAVLSILVAGMMAAALIVNPSEVGDAVGAALFFAIIIDLGAGPTWSLLAYGCASLQLLTQSRPDKWRWKITDALLLTGWIAAAFAAWRKSMDIAIAEYATLPMENPNCFICSAAARGHVRFVRSESITIGDERRRVTHQLRVLKAAELVLLATFPGVHAVVRGAYNSVGPLIARRVRNPWTADVIYTALKPAEWLAALFLWLAVGASRAHARRLYTNRVAPGASPSTRTER